MVKIIITKSQHNYSVIKNYLYRQRPWSYKLLCTNCSATTVFGKLIVTLYKMHGEIYTYM